MTAAFSDNVVPVDNPGLTVRNIKCVISVYGNSDQLLVTIEDGLKRG
jgi:hypothetical protein